MWGIPVKGAAERARNSSPLVDLDGNGLSDDLEKILADLLPQAQVDVVVTFSGPGNAASSQRAVGPFTLTQEYNLIEGFAAAMSASQARALAGVPGVFRVEEDFPVYANLEWARTAVGATQVVDFLGFTVRRITSGELLK